jgi:uncharacterized protein YqfA (UPF0365 family)
MFNHILGVAILQTGGGDIFPLLAILGSLVGIFSFLYFVPINLWITALFSGVKVGLFELIFMRIRRVPPRLIVEALITSTKAGLKLTTSELETHYLAGGNVPLVIKSLISADKANIDMSYKQATAIDLAGRDVLEAVRTTVNPKVINTPPVAAIAHDGIQLIVKAKVTVRVNISQLVGGAGEETIIARVGEGIVTAIGSSVTHKEILENPEKISKLVLSKGLDAGTAYEILSIDIADIDIGANIGAKLITEKADADLKVADARAEERRAMAVALEQEMKAKAEEARAKVIEAEAQIPQAIAEAFRAGNISISDYYKLKNMQADTEMRESFASDNTKQEIKRK